MRIAQVSPLYESVPPKLYGGTERIVSYLTEELVNQGHDVTLYASGDSITRAKLVGVSREALRLHKGPIDPNATHFLLMERVTRDAAEGLFDIVHFHVEYWAFPYTKCWHDTPHISTVHSRLDLPEAQSLFGFYPEVPLVSISDAQQEYLPQLNWVGTIPHGLPEKHLIFKPQTGRYLAFLGRISREKRVDRAIAIAKAVGMPLKIAAKIDTPDRPYFEKEIKYLMDDPLIEYIGEITDNQKAEFLGNAYALLFPIDWPEPFGLVMVEAMACGTPVVAFNCGSVKEVIDDGRTGFVVNDMSEAVDAVSKVALLSRAQCRQDFETKFSTRRMALDYVNAYEKILRQRKSSVPIMNRMTLL